MEAREISEQVIKKVNNLLTNYYSVVLLPREEFSQNRMLLGRFIVCQDLISNTKGDFWEWMLYVDFLKNPILIGESAKGIAELLIGKNESALDKYLNELIPENTLPF